MVRSSGSSSNNDLVLLSPLAINTHIHTHRQSQINTHYYSLARSSAASRSVRHRPLLPSSAADTVLLLVLVLVVIVALLASK